MKVKTPPDHIIQKQREPFLLHRLITYCIAAIWLINGFYCKVLNQVPRHEQIVARIAGSGYADLLTRAIGVSEILMSVWIISRIRHKLNAVVQITIIAIMNFIEFIYARDLLLWGSWNAVFALMLILLIYFNEFMLARNKTVAI